MKSLVELLRWSRLAAVQMRVVHAERELRIAQRNLDIALRERQALIIEASVEELLSRPTIPAFLRHGAPSTVTIH